MGYIRKTSFGSLEVLYTQNDKVISELAIFLSNGKSHKHDKWEVCYVIEGQGRIVIEGRNTEIVKAGSIINIPPETGHWMEVERHLAMKILLVYTDKIGVA